MSDIWHRVGIGDRSPRCLRPSPLPMARPDSGPETSRAIRGSVARSSSTSAVPIPSAVMDVIELDQPRSVQWRCVAGPDEWRDAAPLFRAGDVRRRDRGAVHPCQLVRTGGVHAPLQYQLGLLLVGLKRGSRAA